MNVIDLFSPLSSLSRPPLFWVRKDWWLGGLQGFRWMYWDNLGLWSEALVTTWLDDGWFGRKEKVTHGTLIRRAV